MKIQRAIPVVRTDNPATGRAFDTAMDQHVLTVDISTGGAAVAS